MTKIAPRPVAGSSTADTARGELYEADFALWIDRQAALLRSGRIGEVDHGNLAEELEDMGKRQRQDLRSRLEVLLAHLLKYEFQSGLRMGSWLGTIAEQRARIEDLVEESPSLRPVLESLAGEATFYDRARRQAILETGLPAAKFPHANPYGARALDRDFWPGEGPHPDLG
ncbi:DUF29 domain-containing protein [Azospirillum sp. SYSU D00513]|uniref:DUF29 domain-containing protein n=1 Tax=Azospirillum sp. SYSU D00513 TaxID=2812561 RepID=UPI001A973862|nr:DUF29 domain-containing protein [Azospirillum sp. SYSU D00513]